MYLFLYSGSACLYKSQFEASCISFKAKHCIWNTLFKFHLNVSSLSPWKINLEIKRKEAKMEINIEAGSPEIQTCWQKSLLNLRWNMADRERGRCLLLFWINNVTINSSSQTFRYSQVWEPRSAIITIASPKWLLGSDIHYREWIQKSFSWILLSADIDKPECFVKLFKDTHISA